MSTFIFKGGLIINNKQLKIKKSDDLINEDIRFKELLLIDDQGTQVGIVSSTEALQLAYSKNLDLVCVAPQAKPPVCKIIDYGKYRFEAQKKAKEAKKNQKIQDVKEIRITPVIDVGDLNTKLKNARKFLEKGDKLKVSMRFRGRQMTHTDLGMEIMNKFFAQLEEIAQLEKAPKLEGNNIFMYIAPKKK